MGGPGRRSALERHHDGGVRVGRAAGRGRAHGDEEPQGHLPGGVGRHRAAGDPASPRQRLEQRLLLPLQRARDTAPPSRRTSTGPSSTASRTTSPRTRSTRSASTPRPRSGPASSAPAPRRASRTPTSGPTCRRPRHVLDRAHRLVPAQLEDVRAVLRRAVQLEQVRADVAVVRRRRHHQQLRLRLRPDRHRAAEVAPPRSRDRNERAPPTTSRRSPFLGVLLGRVYSAVPASSGSSLSDGLSRLIAFSRHLSANSASSAPSRRRVRTSAPRVPASAVIPSSSVSRASS